MRKIAFSSIKDRKGTYSGKVSVIITNYKKEPYLKKAVLSCLAQTYKDIEIIVVDDCSNKPLVANILREINSDKIRLLYTTRNYGHYACCNYAIDQANGDFVTFLGGDDIITRDHIAGLLLSLEKYSLKAVCSTYARYSADGKIVGNKGRLCEASILFKKNRVIKDVGHFHMVRCAADTEYRERIIRFYGSSQVGLLCRDSYQALYSEGSLTSSRKTKRGSPSRAGYVQAFMRRIKGSRSRGDLYFNYKRDKMNFPLKAEIKVAFFDRRTFGEVLL